MRLSAMVVLAVAIIATSCSGSDEAGDSPEPAATRDLECAWPMFGHGADRTFAYPDDCATEISPATVNRLQRSWFYRTPDVVTATPAVADGVAYVGDWAGNFFAISLADGSVRWQYKAEKHPVVYSGQVVASAAVADVAEERRVFFASGKTMFALDATTGKVRWQYKLNPAGDAEDPTEIQSSPVVADGKVIFGFDGHDSPETRAGIVALDAATGELAWAFDPDGKNPPTGCGGVWSSPAVDVERGLVFAGSANCVTAPAGWNDYSEAIFALDLKTGAPKWSYQPRGPSNNDFDFAGAPNLFETDGEARVGLGGKDGIYYALDRETGKLRWKYETTTPRVRRNFSSGGFIGATAIDDGVIVGGTAVGGACPCLHGINADDGKRAWNQEEPAPTFAASAIVNGVAFSGSTTDFTLRAVHLKDGTVLWSHEMVGGVAGGTATDGVTLVAVAGIREPGVSPAGTQSGVYGFTLGSAETTTSAAQTAATLPPTSAAPPPTAPDPNAPQEPRCIASACELDFSLKKPPAGLTPAISVHLRPTPFRIETRADDLGEPEGWLRPGSSAEKKGAVTYGVFASDDALKGSLLCVLDAEFDCVNEVLPANVRPGYNRITILAIANTPVLPSAAEGFDRIVSSISLREPVTLR